MRRRWGPSMTGPVEVIIPLLVLRLGLGGDFLGCTSQGLTVTVLGGRSSSPSTFLLAEPLETAVGTDEDVPSYPLAFFASSFLPVVAACTLCLAASISAKDNKCASEKQVVRTKLKRMVQNLLTTTRVFIQSSSFKCRLRVPAL